MKVLIVGGGREHALARKAAQPAKIDQVYMLLVMPAKAR